jgi:hypothetical protein
MRRYVATGVLRDQFVEILSINDGIALVEFTFGGQADVEYSSIEGVWPTTQVLDNFVELAQSFTGEGVVSMIETMTQTPEWAQRIATLVEELY